MSKRGRPSLLNNKFIANTLSAIQNHAYFEVSYYHLDKMVEMGYLDRVDIKQTGRGRPSKSYVPSKKGLNLLRLSKNWFKKVS